jgi:FkbM family methyltransferase
VRSANVAIGEDNGTVTIYGVDRRPGDPEWVDQIASLDLDVLRRHAYALADLDDRIVPTEVESVRLPTLMSRYGVTSVDLMHIDAEGFDDEIIRQVEMSASWAPRFLIYEKKHLDADRYRVLRDLLERSGYRIVDIWPDELAYRAAPRASS